MQKKSSTDDITGQLDGKVGKITFKNDFVVFDMLLAMH